MGARVGAFDDQLGRRAATLGIVYFAG